MKTIDRRQFLELLGMTTMAGTLNANIAKALAIPAHHRTGTIQDVEHVVVLMQENNPFDKYFGTMRGVRGFADPRAATIHLPQQTGTGTVPASVFLQPAGAANVSAGYGVSPTFGSLGGPATGAEVIPPFRIDPAAVSSGLKSLGLTYLPGTDHGWQSGHEAWNQGQYDQWAVAKGPVTMAYLTRDDIPYHYALADAFTVGDNYHCSIMGPTNPNRMYLWTGCVGNVGYLKNGTDGQGSGTVTGNGLGKNDAYYVWETFPEVLQSAGISWRIYQDIAGSPFAPDLGDGTSNSFAGNYTDNAILYFNQYATAPTTSPLYQNAATGTSLTKILPATGAPAAEWQAWAEHLFDDFRKDVQSGKLPQVSWIVAPAGYTEHPDWPSNYGAWYISQIFDILVSNPEVWSKTVFIINYDENDGGFDHLVPPTPPQTAANGASTAAFDMELVATADPSGPIGLGVRVPFLAISPWSKGGYVNSQCFDHTSVIQFLEKRFGVHEKNISPWRRAVSGDLTSLFNFSNPNSSHVGLPDTAHYLPPTAELAGGDVTTYVPTSLNGLIIGVPHQERGVRPARALPYALEVQSAINHAKGSITLTFLNSGKAGAVFQVRSGNASDPVRNYTVEGGKHLSGTWAAASTYDLTVHGPNGFLRAFKGSVKSKAAALELSSLCRGEGPGAIEWNVVNTTGRTVTIVALDAYTGRTVARRVAHQETLEDVWSLHEFGGWYDVIIMVADDHSLRFRLAGHVETGRDSVSDPVLGGHALKG